jgi:hypothetical protein
MIKPGQAGGSNVPAISQAIRTGSENGHLLSIQRPGDRDGGDAVNSQQKPDETNALGCGACRWAVDAFS